MDPTEHDEEASPPDPPGAVEAREEREDPAAAEVAVLESRARHFARLLPIPLAAAALLAILAGLLGPVVVAAAPIFVIVSVMAALARANRPRRLRARGAPRIDERGLSVGARLVVPRARLREAVVVPETREGVLVRIGQGLGATDLVVGDPELGRRLLARLRLDAAHTTGRVAVRAPSVGHYRARARLALPALLFVPFAVALGIASELLLILPIAAVALFLPIALSMAVSGDVTVGTDGVLVRWLWQRRFIPLDDVIDARVAEEEPMMNAKVVVVRLYRADGSVKETLMVDAAQEGDLQESFRTMVDARAQSLAERIREAIASRAAGAEDGAARALERGDRAGADWIGHLRGLLARAETFRDAAAPTREALLRIVENAREPAPTRAAAAVAALSSSDGDARARVRVAAQTSAAPRLRVALERISADEASEAAEDAALAEALDALDAPARRAPRDR